MGSRDDQGHLPWSHGTGSVDPGGHAGSFSLPWRPDLCSALPKFVCCGLRRERSPSAPPPGARCELSMGGCAQALSKQISSADRKSAERAAGMAKRGQHHTCCQWCRVPAISADGSNLEAPGAGFARPARPTTRCDQVLPAGCRTALVWYYARLLRDTTAPSLGSASCAPRPHPRSCCRCLRLCTQRSHTGVSRSRCVLVSTSEVVQSDAVQECSFEHLLGKETILSTK